MIALALVLACDAGALDKVEGDPAATEDTGAGVLDTREPTVPPEPTIPPTDTPVESGSPPAVTGETGTAPGTADTSLDPLPVLPATPDVLVDCTGAADFLTIQAAIDASVSGTKIGVQPCTYFERIDFRGKSLDVYAMDGPAATILDGAGEGPIVTLTHGESDGTRLAGFTLTHGRTVDGASAVRVEYARVTLQDLVVTDNYRSDWAIFTLGAFVDIRDTTITANVYDSSGAAPISAETGSLLVSARSTRDVLGWKGRAMRGSTPPTTPTTSPSGSPCRTWRWSGDGRARSCST
ncbi:MAG: hypothetical protein H0V89_00925 [Deltaproteobacteria bacterium]|nr:hypothetical protein [Deltaproteobacteria bacterium]